MYACLCVYICTENSLYMESLRRITVCMYVYIYIYIYMYVCMYICTENLLFETNTCMYICMYVYMCVYALKFIVYRVIETNSCMQPCMYTYTQREIQRDKCVAWKRHIHTLMYVCMYALTTFELQPQILTYIHMYVCLCLYAV